MNIIADIINKILLGNTSLSGLRTIILNTIAVILGLWAFLSKDGGLFTFLCEQSSTFEWLMTFCNIDQTQFYVVALTVVGVLGNILRFLTVAPVGERAGPAELRLAHEEPDGKKKFAHLIMLLSVGVLIGLIITAIF